MPEANPAKGRPNDGGSRAAAPPETKTRREVGQVTLSTIRDVSLAAREAVERAGEPSRRLRWLPVLGFFFLLYVASSWLALSWLKSALWMHVFLVPLLPVLVATLTLAWCQRWKFRAQSSQSKLKIWQNALGSLGHDAANATNAIRANLTAFRMTNPQISTAAHLDEIESAAKRVEVAVQKSQDPASWKGK